MAINTEPQLIDESMYLDGSYAPRRMVLFPREDEHWSRIQGHMGEIDSVTLDVLEWALEAAIDECEAAVERTAVSTIIREQHDYRASLNTLDCNSVTRVSWRATSFSTTTSTSRRARSATCPTSAS
jgi:N-methylhydantoinase B